MTAPSRNAPCPCGSGKKYKNCCLGKSAATQLASTQKILEQSEDQLFQIALQHHQAGHWPQAENVYRHILQNNPDHPDALHLLGTLYHQTGNHEMAVVFIGRAIRIDPSNPFFHDNLGTVYQALGKLDNAISCYQKALALEPSYTGAHFNLGNVLYLQEQLDAAATCYQKALALQPDYVDAYIGLGNIFKDLDKLDEAISCYQKALAFNPDYAEVHFNLGIIFQEQDKLNEAIECYRKALALRPDYAEAHFNLGNALKDQGKQEAALECYHRALSAKPNYAEVHNNIGLILQNHEQSDRAIDSFNKALALNPDYADAHFNLGKTMLGQKRYADARANYQKALSIMPDCDCAYGMYLHSKMHCCDWERIDDDFRELLDGVNAGKMVSPPFALLAIPSTPAQQKRCAEIFAQKYYAGISARSNTELRYSHNKIRLGYFSADFHNHPCSYLMAGLFEGHDRSRFELTAFSFGPNKNDEMQKRVSASFDNFIDVRNLSDQEVAMLARSLEIDIAVDRKGYTENNRTGIFAFRAAPVQVSYLAYPGTMGAKFIDYFIADSTLIPVDSRQHYTEKIAYLPNSYQVNDAKRAIADKTFTREEVGLPDAGFVFCCFNNNYKITPAVFDIWMQLLQQVNGSVLWVLQDNAYATQNLTKEAIKRGIAPERLVFAPRMSLPEHLARHRLADLFLDTFFCNAHTTASDALWAGLPVLTYLGDTLAGRVAASLLNAIGLPELITHSHEEYQALALELATNPAKLASLKQQLAQNRLTHPLFDTRLSTRHIEDAFTQMWERHQAALLPEHIYVGANEKRRE